ncbi:MAG: isopenicillin N synthase family oxygenase [Flavobacteriales bacterium]|jgi:isopenicillin N synthase-like dioxygenase|nr:isopenicillin N synthase family oxygenase [Flavobacteriales bacterium]
MKNIPSVDLADFLSGDKERKAKFVKELGAAYEDIGFVSVKNHGFGDTLQEQLYKNVKDFFSLPLETKKKYEIPGIAGQRGYVSFGKESAKGVESPDLKEFWHFGQYVENKEKYPYPENVTVEELPEFNPTGKATYQKLESIGRSMLQAISLHLGLDEFYFDSRIKDGNSILRPIHYPPITEEPKDAVRSAQHEDINLITLLMGASADGLQVLNKNNEWVGVTSIENHIVVNVGDMLQRLTNGKLKSTTHRVVNPPKEQWGQPRYSIPFFLHPTSDTSLYCLESCIDENNPKQFEDMTAGEYLTERLIELGLIEKK